MIEEQLVLRPRIKDRGKFLTTLFVLKGAFGLVMLFIALAALSAMTPDKLERLPPPALEQILSLRARLILTFGTTIFDLVAVTGMWMFKRWGVYVFVVSSLTLLVLRFAHREALETVIATISIFVSGSILGAIHPKWPDYD